jgi:hypothetical protein
MGTIRFPCDSSLPDRVVDLLSFVSIADIYRFGLLMARIQHNAKLNQLVVDLGKSLLQFVNEVSPWSPAGATTARETVSRLVNTQKECVDRLSELLVARRCRVEFGVYPAEFTDLHFLSLKALLPRIIASQDVLVAELDEAAHTCVDDPEAALILSDILAAQKSGTDELRTLKV